MRCVPAKVAAAEKRICEVLETADITIDEWAMLIGILMAKMLYGVRLDGGQTRAREAAELANRAMGDMLSMFTQREEREKNMGECEATKH